MRKKKLDIDKICNLTQEIIILKHIIIDSFPDGNDEILRHLATSSMHLAFFARDLFEISKGEILDEKSLKEFEDKFLNECGCDIGKDEE